GGVVAEVRAEERDVVRLVEPCGAQRVGGPWRAAALIDEVVGRRRAALLDGDLALRRRYRAAIRRARRLIELVAYLACAIGHEVVADRDRTPRDGECPVERLELSGHL